MTKPLLDAASLADDLHREVRLIAAASEHFDRESSDALVLTDDEKLRRLTDAAKVPAPLPDREALATVIAEVFWASMTAEEGRPCRPRLIFSPGGGPPTHRFSAPTPMTREVLRKLSPIHDAPDCLAWELDAQGRPVIVGVLARPPFQIPAHRGVVIAVSGPGSIELAWNMERLVTLRAGKVTTKSTCGLGDLAKVAAHVGGIVRWEGVKFAASVVFKIVEEGHGGSLWFCERGTMFDGVNIGTPVTLDDSRSLLERVRAASPTERGGLGRLEFVAWLRSVARLANIDGAVVVDWDLRVVGFGAFIDTLPDEEASQIIARSETGPPRTITSLKGEGWGARHRSAIAFCQRNLPAVAFVVSQDGSVTVFYRADADGPVVCERTVALGEDRLLRV